MPNQFGIDYFDLEDAFSEQKEYMCSSDLKEFVEKYHLNLAMDGSFDVRSAFGSHDDAGQCIQYAARMVYGALPESEYLPMGRGKCGFYACFG